MNFTLSREYAQQLDAADVLKDFRNRFHFPQHNGKPAIYLTGNSLGLQPKTARQFVEQEFTDWQNLGVEGHLQGKNPWLYYHHFYREQLAKIVGAKKDEVVALGSLTNNLHLLMVSFYRPTKQRYKIMMEANAFPSDQYAMQSQVELHGFNYDDAVIEISPRNGEHTLRTEDILKAIDEHKNELALLMFGGVNYLSGQYFEMEKITAAGHAAGAVVGFDLAHAAGNVPLQLHNWNIDFACWCSYKYLNSGPGGVAGIFVHEKHATEKLNRFAGWWGNDETTRFQMKRGFIPQPGAASWQLSNAPVFAMAIHCASLQIFDEAKINRLRTKSELLTGYLEFVVEHFNETHPTQKLNIITPKDKSHRGSQLSLVATGNGNKVFDTLTSQGVIADWREPNVIRMAPVPLYNSFEDIFNLSEILMNLN